jgi:pimeloyl-ACP methyl ester carboxylesterase
MTPPVPKEIEIQTPFLRIAAKQWGPGDGIPVLGLHGWLDNASTFDRIAPLLPRINLFSIDLPGHGRSDHRPPGVRYHFGDYVDDVMAVADVLGWERFVLMGHSMGGGVASLCAATFPERISNLIQIEGFGVVTYDTRHAPSAMRQAVLAMKRPPQRKRPGYTHFDALVEARAKAGNISRSAAETLLNRSVARDDDGLVWLSDQRLLMPVPHYFSDDLMLAFLQRIETDVLLITGLSGTLKKRHYFESRCKAVQSLSWVELPGNHHLHLDYPEPVARAIADFLETQT